MNRVNRGGQRRGNNNNRQRNQRQTNQSNQSNQNDLIKMVEEFEIDDTGELQVVLASKIVDFKVALNALSADGTCPCCLDEWSKVRDGNYKTVYI